ncbi:MAG: DUF4845 domain-containing protein [Zoogloeaceae bacterium]|nr:DUF4845 domain-containing protein [Zoogloeaceae bacterium]
MRKQAGVSLIGMLIIVSLGAFILLLGFRALPAYSEYFAVQKILNAIAKESNSDTSVADIRRNFEKRADIEYVQTVGASDLVVEKQGGKVALSMEYERRVPIAGNVSLVFAFNPTSSARPGD